MKFWTIMLLILLTGPVAAGCGSDGEPECNDETEIDIDVEGGTVGTNDSAFSGSNVITIEIGPRSGTPGDGNLVEGPRKGGTACNQNVRDCSGDYAN